MNTKMKSALVGVAIVFALAAVFCDVKYLLSSEEESRSNASN